MPGPKMVGSGSTGHRQSVAKAWKSEVHVAHPEVPGKVSFCGATGTAEIRHGAPEGPLPSNQAWCKRCRKHYWKYRLGPIRKADETPNREMRRAQEQGKLRDPAKAYEAAKAKGYPHGYERFVASQNRPDVKRAQQAAEKEARQHTVIPETVRKIPIRRLIHAGPARKAGLSLAGLATGVGALKLRHHEPVSKKWPDGNLSLGGRKHREQWLVHGGTWQGSRGYSRNGRQAHAARLHFEEPALEQRRRALLKSRPRPAAIRAIFKADDRHVDQAIGAAAGASGANAVSIVGGQGTKGYLTRARAKRGETPHQQAVWAEHKRKFGVTAQAESKTSNATKYKIFSRYPKELPHWRLQRALGVKNHPAAATGIIASGALLGAHQAGKFHDRVTTSKADDRTRNEAIGAGAGALVAPGRTINPRGRNLHPLANRGEGVHMMDPRDLSRYARGTGVRFGERSHVAALAHSMRTEGYHPSAGPIHLNVYSDRAKISDGAHRAHAAAIAGVKKVPVHIHRTTGEAPSSWRGGQILDHLRTQRQQTAYDRHAGDSDWMRRRAKDVVKPESWRAKVNQKAASAGEKVASAGPLRTLAHNRYTAANVGLIGGGAYLGSKLTHKPVRKSSSYTDVQARRLRRRDKSQAGLGLIEAGVALGGLKGKSLPARLAFATPGLAASGQAVADLRQDEYGWSRKERDRRQGRVGMVGKAADYGYMQRKRSVPKTAEMLAGLGMLGYGVPRLHMLGPAAAKGVRLADKHGGGKEARAALELASAFGRRLKHYTGRGETQLRRSKTLDHAISAVPASVRGEVATAAGVLVAADAHPTTREKFTAVGSDQ